MNNISNNIKFLRLQNGLTQEELANIVNKSRVLISQWESDSREITTEDIIKLSDYFNIPMDELVGKDLRALKPNPISQREILFNKSKYLLSEEDWETIEFIVNKAIKRYEESNKNNERHEK